MIDRSETVLPSAGPDAAAESVRGLTDVLRRHHGLVPAPARSEQVP